MRRRLSVRGDGYVVNFAYGRRGGKLTTGTKTKVPVSLAEAQAIFNKIVGEKRDKGYQEPNKSRVTAMASHCQFYIQPRYTMESFFDDSQFDDEVAQGFGSWPLHATIHCDDVWEIAVDAEVTDVVPPLDGVAQAACMPIEVLDDLGLSIRCPDSNMYVEPGDDDEAPRVAIPSGRYDMLVRIYPTTGTGEDRDEDDDDEDESDDDFNPTCRVSLSFLPRGTVGVKCFKRDGYSMPSKLVIHNETGGVDEFPVEPLVARRLSGF